MDKKHRNEDYITGMKEKVKKYSKNDQNYIKLISNKLRFSKYAKGL